METHFPPLSCGSGFSFTAGFLKHAQLDPKPCCNPRAASQTWAGGGSGKQGTKSSLMPMADRVDSLGGCADTTAQTVPVQGQHRADVWHLHKGSTTMAEAVLDHRICPAGRRVQAEDKAGRGRASPALNQATPESRLLPRFKATHRSPSCSS